ncbi:MAG TPA: CAP domain-containing protein [Actinomycetota bacterium]|nr:CAP domain-containing protein [Actinomycetota bacterium]
MNIKRAVPTAILCVLATAIPAGAETESNCWRATKAERRMTRSINDSRGESNRRPLRLDPELSHVARVHAAAMVNKGEIFHNDKLETRVTRWKILGENVGRGKTTSSVHRSFMASQTHRSNILGGRFFNVGVGVKSEGDTMWVAIVFEGKRNPGTTLDMPRC